MTRTSGTLWTFEELRSSLDKQQEIGRHRMLLKMPYGRIEWEAGVGFKVST